MKIDRKQDLLWWRSIFNAVIILWTFTLSPSNAMPKPVCSHGGEVQSKVELFFGLAIPGGGKVDSAAWQEFLEQEVTSRFPDGLTVDQVEGQWQDAKTGKIIQESSRVVMIVYTASPEADKNIEEIREAYQSKFDQQSVMRLDEINCVRF
ncbi:DUF3574 domain-containing protein [Crocosphaera sp.]|uniref:DUF3574 domain-containing protein n=1 Tax=Crocosphaera sp. TaxID=2729996 RepID=UPI00262E799F|nr:DUF3574 domain-containing protein [Crocosphaera sp.]MDJ0581459.1 DUF3574 domain-containing protein [Crocosphaera sp.]